MKYIKRQKTLSSLSLFAAPLVILSTTLLTACGGGADSDGADPGIVDYPIAYVKRPYPVDDMGNLVQDDVRDPTVFSTGGDLYVRKRATITADEAAVTTGITQGIGDVKDVDISYDGTKLIFSLRLADPDPTDQIIPRWNIWEYNLVDKTLRRFIADNIIAEEGDDVAPAYLPDGTIVFSSNRQAFSKLQRQNENPINGTLKQFYPSQTEDRNGIAFMLHTMDQNGENIKQITFNQSHDLDPVVLSNGRIAFSRWDNVANRGSGIHIYSINPDGSDLQLMYGSHSHDTGTGGATTPIEFTQPHELPDGNLITIMRPFTNTFSGGDIVELNSNGAVDKSQSSATSNGVTTDGSISPGGRYSAVYPLWDGTGRMLVSKGICQIMVDNVAHFCISPYINNPAATEIPPSYGIWLYDRTNNVEKPLVMPANNQIITDVIATQPRSYPSTASASLDVDLQTDGMGMLHIRSVYDMDGTYNDFGSGIADIQTMASSSTPAANRPARFIRILKTIGMPDPNVTTTAPNLLNTAFGRDRNLGMREIIGYAPVEPDGSVMVKVPANIPLTIEVLDSAGMRLGARHQAWIQVAAGETRSCNGCHSHPNDGSTPKPHGRSGIGSAAVNQGAGFTIAQPLPTTLTTDPNLYAVSGETMAQVRYNRCVNDLVVCSVAARNFDPTVNMTYEDVWATTPNAPINYDYSGVNGLTTPSPSTAECQIPNPNRDVGMWTKDCRTTINYVDHIEPLWSVDRGGNTCTTCHNTRNAANAVQLPGGSLNLTNNRGDYPADATVLPNADQVPSYIEMMFNRDLLTLVGTNLVVSGPRDMNGVLIQADRLNAPMNSAGSRAGRFMSKLTTDLGETVDHTGFLTPAELRLVAEWLDIGGQYYNDPFDMNAPQN